MRLGEVGGHREGAGLWPARELFGSSPESDRFGGVALGILVWALLWLAIGASLSLSPPVDSVEQLAWVRSIEWGYYKHPPLPTMMLWPFVHVFGIHEWVAASVGAGLVCGAVWVSWRLTCELLGAHRAGLAMLGTLCVTYYTTRIDYYNHNVVLLLFVAGAAWFCWRAFAARSLWAWFGVGCMWGLGALSKYQIALACVSTLYVWLRHRGWRDPLHRRGLVLAAGVAALIFMPHLAWLVENDFPPVHYALSSSLGADLPTYQRMLHSLNWLVAQLGRLVPSLLFGIGLALWVRTRRGAMSESVTPGASAAVVDAAPSFLFAWGALPLLTVTFVGLVTGADLQLQWGTAFLPLTCAWLIQCTPRAGWQRVRWRDAMVAFVLVQVLIATFDWATSPMGPNATVIRHRNRNFPSQAIADVLGPAAREALHGPIDIIAGPAGYAETLSLRLAERPLVLIDGCVERSPWFKAQPLEGRPLLWVGGEDDDPPPGAEPLPLPDGLWWAVAEGPQACSSAAEKKRAGTRGAQD